MLGEDRILFRDEYQDIGAEDGLPVLGGDGLVAGGQILGRRLPGPRGNGSDQAGRQGKPAGQVPQPLRGQELVIERQGPSRPAVGVAPGEAASAMSAIDGSRSWLADRIIAPGWFHPAFGLLAGGVIAEAEIHSWVLFASGWGALPKWVCRTTRRILVCQDPLQ
ncbi:MAG: hypothetical protein ACRDPY_21850 [Streptosporangiaceae bacterium]